MTADVVRPRAWVSLKRTCDRPKGLSYIKLTPKPDTCEDVVCPVCRARIGQLCGETRYPTAVYSDGRVQRLPEPRKLYHPERWDKSFKREEAAARAKVARTHKKIERAKMRRRIRRDLDKRFAEASTQMDERHATVIASHYIDGSP